MSQDRISQLTIRAAEEANKKVAARRQRDYYFHEATRLSALAKTARIKARRARRDTFLACAVFASTLLLLALVRRHPAVQQTGFVDRTSTPAYVLGSVRVANGGSRCSATIIAIGDRYAVGVSAKHCFVGRIGGKFTINNPTGSSTEATLAAIDDKHDLALFYVPADGVVGRSCLHAPDEVGGGDVTAVGYTAGQGPKFKEATWIGQLGKNWTFRVDSGPFEGGDSGGGVFLNGTLVAVIWGKQDRTMVTARHDQVYEFVRKNWSSLPAGCGEYG